MGKGVKLWQKVMPMPEKTQPSHILDRPIQYLPGVGPKRARLLKRLGVYTVEDLLYLLPRKYLDRRFIKRIRDLKEGEEATVMGRIFTKGRRKLRTREAFTVVIADQTEWMELTFFTTKGFDRIFRVGDIVIASGKVYRYRGVKVMYHPDWEILTPDQDKPRKAGRIIPIYPATEGLKPAGIESLIRTALELAEPELQDRVPAWIRKKRGLLSRLQALRMLHAPRILREAELARKALAYEEFFLFQLKLRLKRMEYEGHGIAFDLTRKAYSRQFLKSLPFELTEAQKRVIREIEQDVTQERPMHRLLQGDVGSGKTVVALYAMLLAVDQGLQAALMAPTELLAEQHFLVLREFLHPIGLEPTLLTGRQSRKERAESLEAIESGKAKIIVGTHALIQEGVHFKNLGLAVVDEQHRFGVLQRARLLEKGIRTPHFLVMTATPIPRTLAMTAYGDLDVSYLDEKPAGRQEVKTFWRTLRERDKVYRWLFEKVLQGEQAYVVAPLIEKSEALQVQSAQELFQELLRQAPDGVRIGLIHGRIRKEERQRLMEAFREGVFQILVATTVIEVGIDVPNATLMVIEHAERFGLSQLHQLRGRIGRGEKPSYCILLTPEEVTEDAEKRLKTLVETTDGFRIAEVDLQIRGPGEILGKEQHGFRGFRIGNLMKDASLILKVRKDVEELLSKDRYLVRPEHRVLREYLLREEEREGEVYVG